jgi:hypothetical protein
MTVRIADLAVDFAAGKPIGMDIRIDRAGF